MRLNFQSSPWRGHSKPIPTLSGESFQSWEASRVTLGADELSVHAEGAALACSKVYARSVGAKAPTPFDMAMPVKYSSRAQA